MLDILKYSTAWLFQMVKHFEERLHPMSDTPTLPATGREWHLASRPVGWPKPEDFSLVEAEIPTPGEGQVLVRNMYLSVDPYMRGRMSDAKSYVAPYAVGEAMQGGAVGEVVASGAEGLAVGDHVLHGLGWREYALVDAKSAAKVDAGVAPLSAYLGVPGHAGVHRVRGTAARRRRSRSGTTVFVSGRRAVPGGGPGGAAREARGGLAGGTAPAADRAREGRAGSGSRGSAASPARRRRRARRAPRCGRRCRPASRVRWSPP
ncbi:hypothetical protein SHIRM173S_11065 [Streptomyces hirsutus]